MQKIVVMTGSEAVSRSEVILSSRASCYAVTFDPRSIVDSIRVAAATCPDFQRSIPLNRDDESRVEAIEKELIKLGSHVSATSL